jgi:predicted ArsR family transcriptional regulator
MTELPWQAAAALVDPVRRALYDHVRRQDHPVTREEAAAAVSISRTLTAFHLDKLVEAGLLHARYESPTDKQRGRGRTPKVYEANTDGLMLTVPARHYELVGRILSDAIAGAPDDARAAAFRGAGERGRELGAAYADQSAAADADDEMTAVFGTLAGLGFEPRSGAELPLGNCPFHALASEQPELICGLNEAFVGGVLTGLGVATLRARLHPRPGSCCVEVVRSR